LYTGHNRTPHVRFLFGRADYLKIAHQLGAVGTLSKPFANEALLAAINSALEPASRWAGGSALSI
jgi:FixJ family two-component response regulator